MVQLTSILVLFLSFSIQLIKQITANDREHTYRFIKCQSFDPKIIRVEFCSINNTKTLTNLKIGLTLINTLNKPIYLQFSIARKTAGNYFQDYFRTELIEFCSVMEGANANPFFKGILDGIGKTAPNLIHPCPYKAGFIDASNLTIDSTKTFNFPLPGTYKVELTFYGKSKKPFGLIRTNEVIDGVWDKIGRVELPKII